MEIDSFARGIPISKALDPDTLLVYEMNGEPLPTEHGGPLRALVPGFYAMDSVKWLRTVTVSRTPFSGFYQTRRYYESKRTQNGGVINNPLHTMLVKSQIARPIRGATLRPGSIQIAGAAWSGAAEIERVSVSTDGGNHWIPAVLGPEHSRYAWRLWSHELTARAPGQYELAVRAADSAGNEQPLHQDPSILTPYENNWVDRRGIEINR
jgi:sulfite oxidase